jgi:hypothetical protein
MDYAGNRAAAEALARRLREFWQDYPEVKIWLMK